MTHWTTCMSILVCATLSININITNIMTKSLRLLDKAECDECVSTMYLNKYQYMNAFSVKTVGWGTEFTTREMCHLLAFF